MRSLPESSWCWRPSTTARHSWRAGRPGLTRPAPFPSLLEIAENFALNPPKRSVLLLATSGHAQAVAGMREFVWALTTEREDLEEFLKKQDTRKGQGRTDS